MIRNILVAACLVLPVAAMAADEKSEKKMSTQQQKMGMCNKDAGDKKLAGDERKKFMSECLKADHAAAKKEMTPQQQKMATCNKDAGEKKLAGDERKKFMSSCLKG